MQRLISFTLAGLALFVTVSVRAADQADRVIMEAMTLSASPNYSWTTTVEQESGSSVIRGETNLDGYSLITFNARALPNPSASGVSSLSPESGPETTTIFKGDAKYVVQDGNSWALPEKGASTLDAAPAGSGQGNGGAAPGRAQSPRAGASRGRRKGARPTSTSTESSRGEPSAAGERWRPPPAINLPHEELAIIVANYTSLQVAGEVVSGKLTESGADLLLLPPGSTQVPPKGAAGNFRLWLSNGAVTKYELKLNAKQTPTGHETKGGFAETVTVELKDIGTTKFEVPAAARQKLGL